MDDDDKDADEEEHDDIHMRQQQRKRKRRVVAYDRALKRLSIHQDYHGPEPIFNAKDFQCVFRVSQKVYDRIKEKVSGHEFYNIEEYNFFGRLNICKDFKLMIALKHLAYRVATNSWRDYFQMDESTGRKCVEVLCSCIYNNKPLQEYYLRRFTLADAKSVAKLHLQLPGVCGMRGLLDCMHVHWKNCPIALLCS